MKIFPEYLFEALPKHSVGLLPGIYPGALPKRNKMQDFDEHYFEARHIHNFGGVPIYFLRWNIETMSR